MTTILMLLALVAIAAFLMPSLWRLARAATVSGAMLLLLVMLAAAQELPGSGLIAAVLPQLLEILAVLLMAALTGAAAWAKRKFGIDIEAKHRDALHSALMTGARLAAARQMTGAAATALVLDYARQSVPDALAKLSPPASVLKDLAEAKVQEVVQDKLTGPLGKFDTR
ncbi:hypothetical protein E4191_07520 [Paracoccus liaowanqingii]|uniref:Uncharacterized protein n=1 Tax=Paracoccus liaowanqingii TaxID=2560053 RepID=A0A4P7HKE2_9RHOB|nr:hypothetical protein [Paracoccus liaowanqingii]QBX34575.1 hypothetical protein E4191_07520 [Paracoccus liaowanqingii]